MPQRDYLMQQIEEMGYFLASLIRRILKLKDDDKEQEITTALHDSIQEKLSFNIDEAILIENEAFWDLIKGHLTTENHMEKMAELLMLAGKSMHPVLSPERISYLEKSLFMYTHLQETSTNYSFERRDKILEIQQILRSLI
ncbi:MAG TPA: hypothetical protein DCL77_15400 [Prolixibacteraceae bacterium]|jgi:hypothetical protein|nr:hypothetical protein [Prolixibacteraceae bacterium]